MSNNHGKTETGTPSELLLLKYSSINNGKEYDKGFFMELLSSISVVDIDIIDDVISLCFVMIL